jgi:hypothetical protein
MTLQPLRSRFSYIWGKFCFLFVSVYINLLLYFVSAWLGKVSGHCDRNPGSNQGNLWRRNEEAGRGLRGQSELPLICSVQYFRSLYLRPILAVTCFRTVLSATAFAQYFPHCFCSLSILPVPTEALCFRSMLRSVLSISVCVFIQHVR